MLRLFLVVLLAFAFPSAAESATPATNSFRVGTGVVCQLTTPSLVVCSGKRSGSMGIRPTGTPSSARARVRATPATPQLRAGETWRRSGIACTSRAAEVTCTNRSGATLVLSATRVVVLAPDAAVSP